MSHLTLLWLRLAALLHSLSSRLSAGSSADSARPGVRRALASDRGDVPGWVLITVMTAALVVGLWALAGQAFTEFFNDSMDKVRRAG
ncbi:hypothetical protein NQ038_11415 [Brevibacterium sp. 50QC2O2]|jgi:anti-sigma factor RsiW|uniref:hypothetical protein n=1 Tax=Brevibacterium sp. 50QC2O2 TaxID=2968459 RepID=UPI00211CF5EA|nr:hypothetical protein [Brevibacterium sp. 50QC2O2]MCQ9389248.1 hypothetical protein [Brevibacterium sp. 50QC2O2]